MKFVYKGCTYRTENLTDKQKDVMSVEIEKAERKARKKAIPIQNLSNNQHRGVDSTGVKNKDIPEIVKPKNKKAK